MKGGFFLNRIHLQCTRLAIDESIVGSTYVLFVVTKAEPTIGNDALPEANLALHPAVVQTPVMHGLTQF